MEVDVASHECGLIISNIRDTNLESSDLDCTLNLEKGNNSEMLIANQSPDEETETIISSDGVTDENTVILEGCLSFNQPSDDDSVVSQQTVIESGYTELDTAWHMQMVANGDIDTTGLVTDVKTENIQTVGELGDEWHMQIQLISLVSDSEVKVENEETVTASGEPADKESLVEAVDNSMRVHEMLNPAESNIILIQKDIETEENCIPLEVVSADGYGNTYLDVGVQTIGEEYTVTEEVCSSDEKEVVKIVSTVPKKYAVTSDTCAICGMKFPNRSACQRHMIGVHEEAKHQCSKCKKTFFRLYSLKLHIKKKHNGEGLFFCDKCKYCFICKYYFDQHRKRNCTPVHCRECGRGLGNLIQLHNHRRWVHKLKV
ncbi:zinc finger protein 239 [Octopus bimaculoides]|uniref:C2H2-type domain-containing protein n=1 Tax=Octopus bimaculoides TaxID=37653 RepID=A0A0L8FGZ1_OCTBM|nr:zinc finger protein 239 [Octopus bimaculoides]|eukprot:XP_014790108.1 PREDICTED: zinc finger protein 239-like [Octopus bimaculoides]